MRQGRRKSQNKVLSMSSYPPHTSGCVAYVRMTKHISGGVSGYGSRDAPGQKARDK